MCQEKTRTTAMNGNWNEWIACNYYIGLRAHFGNDKFDFLRMLKQNKCFYKSENYINRRDRILFQRLSSQYKPLEYLKYILSNIIYTSTSKDHASRMHLSEMSEDKLKLWNGKTESLFYNFKNDISRLMNTTDSFNDLFVIERNQIPLVLQTNVSIETLTILNSMVNFSEKFDKEMEHYLWPLMNYKVKNYNSLLKYFTKYDKNKYKDYLLTVAK
jgi:hypothetical protein